MLRLLALVVALTALLGAVWLARRDTAKPRAPIAGDALEHARPTVELAAAVAPELEDAPLSSTSARVPAPAEAVASSPAPVVSGVVFPRSTLAGTVVSADGERVADAEVVATCAPFPAQLGPLGQTRSRADGSFEIECLGTGPFWLEARLGKERGRADEMEAGRRDVEIVLRAPDDSKPPTATLRGTVVDPRGAPVPRATVVASQTRVLDPAPPAQERADSKGVFELRAAPTGAVLVAAGALGFASSEPVRVDLQPGSETTLELRLRDVARVTGVVRGHGGAPVAGVSVSAAAPPAMGEWTSGSLWYGNARATTDSVGRFELAALPGRVNLFLEVPKPDLDALERARDTDAPAGVCLERSVTPGPGESAHVEIALDSAPIRLHGSLEVGGRVPADAMVLVRAVGVSPLRARYADGSYDVVLPGPGAYTFLIHVGDGSLQPAVDVPDGVEHRFDVLVPLARIEGRVRDAGGRGLAGVTVDAMRHGDDQHSSGRAVTAANGAYAIEVPPGTYRVSPRVEFERERSFEEPEDRIVTLLEGAPTRGVDFALRRAGAVEGVVRLPGGARAAGAEVGLRGSSPSTAVGESADDRGRFRFVSVPAARVWVGASGGGEAPFLVTREPVVVDPGQAASELSLQLVPATRLRVRLAPLMSVSSWSRVEVLDVAGRAVCSHKLPERGEDLLHDFALVAPGPYLVRALHGGAKLERAIELTGSEQELDLRSP